MKSKMTNRSILSFTGLILFLIILTGCRTHWTVSNQKGNIPQEAFLEAIPFEFDSKFIIIPVVIKGKTYRFLYDTGAPFGVSKSLQEELNFEVVSKSHIKDTDNNRSETQWVQVDTLLLGDVPFCNFSAFVADFRANPVLACFNVDGIIGSNNIRMCNWFIDYENETLHYTNQKADTFGVNGFNVPFELNRQYSIMMDIKSGPVTLINVELDTGSNGDLSIYPSQFDTLVKYNQTNKVYTKNGVKQSGILGQVTPIASKHSQLDSLVMGDLTLTDVVLSTGSSKLLGNEILSLYHLVIDSQSQKLIFEKNGIEPEPYSSFGFSPGSNDGVNVFVQSVYTDSPAAKAGIVSNMEILNYDSLDFKTTHNICDFVKYAHGVNQKNPTSILKVRAENGDTLTIELRKMNFYE